MNEAKMEPVAWLHFERAYREQQWISDTPLVRQSGAAAIIAAKAAETAAVWKFAAKLDSGSPIFEQDIEALKANIASCKRQAFGLRVSQAQEIIQTIRIANELRRAA